MSQYPLQLKQYFFTQIECNANPDYDQAVNGIGSFIDFKFVVLPFNGQEDALGVELTIWVDEEKSTNPAYLFKISAFGILHVAEGTTMEAATQLAHLTGTQILVGAIREEIAHLTSRGPWGVFMLPIIPLIQTSPQPLSE